MSDLERYVEALKQENSQLLAGDGTNRSMDSSGSSIRRVSSMVLCDFTKKWFSLM